jgi:type II secretory pathway pseudopilin PulG
MWDPSQGRGGRARRRAFSLLDVVLTLAITAVLAAMAVPRYGASITRYRADLAANRIITDLDLLRTRARAQGSSESAYFYVDGDYVRYYGDPDLDDSAQEYFVYLREPPYYADIVEVSFDGGREIRMRYGNYGHPWWGGYVVIKVGGEKRKVVVHPDTGRAYVE